MTANGQADWFRNFAPAPQAPVRLVCLPHAGGSAGYYVPVARALAPRVEVLAVQYPGRQDRRHEAPFTDVRLLADAVAERLAPYADRPLALFGHSMGATVGYEVALRLEAAGRGPAHLFVSGRRAPSVVVEERWHLATDAGLVREVKSLAGTDTAFLDDPELLEMVLPVIRADYRAVETYRADPAAPRLACPVTALTGDHDPKAAVEHVLRWERHTTGGFTAQVFSGGHFYLNDHAADVLRTVAARLEPGVVGVSRAAG
ncbi:thioesterase II family protein [Streptomyces mangrovisoli]|uniref:Thioesterase n=1 Tax=Streptomyces mangrovisoli TaxID=1428628 RepID=A0A1J4P0C9_9ACTN|nr:alpha/beta fold hydrolase [Streptomyces mangrovisoli]OIJ68199.1 thioesterase [Streptomyces mangrovisoli]